MTVEEKKDFLIKTAYFLLVVALIFIVYKFLVIYFFPFIIGLILSYLLQKPSRKVAGALKIKTGIAAAAAVALSFAAVAGVIVLLFTAVAANAGKSAELIKNSAADVMSFLKKLADRLPDSVKNFAFFKEKGFAESFTARLAQLATNASANIVKALPSLFFSSVITVVASCYIAKDYDAVRDYIFSVVPEKKMRVFSAAVRIITTNVFKIIRGYLILMVITFALLLAGFLIMRMKNALVLAAIIAFIDLLPVLGTGTVLIPWSIVLISTGKYIPALSLILLYLIIAAVHNFLEPKIVGRQIGIPPLVMLICIFIGLKLFGFLGMILSVISLVVIINLYKEKLIEL